MSLHVCVCITAFVVPGHVQRCRSIYVGRGINDAFGIYWPVRESACAFYPAPHSPVSVYADDGKRLIGRNGTGTGEAAAESFSFS